MPPLRFLCLHGTGTSVPIFQAQLRPLARQLEEDHSAEFHFIEGEVCAPPGPGVEGFFDGPFYSYWNFPQSRSEEDERSLNEAYEYIYDVVESEGPFDGILGFSHGATLASSFVAHHATRDPFNPLFRCAVFFCGLEPFVLDEDGSFVVHKAFKDKIIIPTLHVIGKTDFVRTYSERLYDACEPTSRQLITHERGHEIPSGLREVKQIAKAIQDLNQRVMLD